MAEPKLSATSFSPRSFLSFVTSRSCFVKNWLEKLVRTIQTSGDSVAGVGGPRLAEKTNNDFERLVGTYLTSFFGSGGAGGMSVKNKSEVKSISNHSCIYKKNILNKLILNLPSNINLHLAVSGDMNLLNIPDSKLNQIRIFKDIPSQMMASFYHGIHILFNPILHKAVPTVTLEAMACGRPVIMYNLNNNETPKDNIDGFIINRDINELLELLTHLSNNTGKISEIGKQAFKSMTRQPLI